MFSIRFSALSLILISAAAATPANQSSRRLIPPPTPCDEALDCRDCLDSGCAWTDGTCQFSCDTADTSCYSYDYFPEMSSREICRMDWTEQKNWNICSMGSTCDDCTSLQLYNNDGNCYWHPDSMSCMPVMYTMDTVGYDRCMTYEERICSDASATCGSCLEAGCDWAAGGECIPSCDDIGDAECWSQSYFPNLGTTAICQLAVVDNQDEDLCGAETDCLSCVDTVRFDGYNTCQWYKDSFTGEQWCGTGDCDMNGNCGEALCDVNIEVEVIEGDVLQYAAAQAAAAEGSVRGGGNN